MYDDTDPGLISFRLSAREHTLTLAQIREAFGFRVPCTLTTPDEYDENQFWYEISGRNEFRAASARASCIINPVLRYMHRMIAHTIVGSFEGASRVGSFDLFFLWCMLHNFMIDSASCLALHLRHVARSKKGKIVIGGLITPLAQLVGCSPPPTAEQATGNVWIDWGACRAMSLIRSRGTSHSCIFPDGRPPLPLPDPERTTIRNPRNWLMLAEGEPVPEAVPSPEHEPEDEPEYDPAPEPAPAPQPHHGIDSSTSSFSTDAMMSVLQAIRLEQLQQSERLSQQNEYLNMLFEEQNRQRAMFERMDTSITRIRDDLDYHWGAEAEDHPEDAAPADASGSGWRPWDSGTERYPGDDTFPDASGSGWGY